jgi:hypothetical protein
MVRIFTALKTSNEAIINQLHGNTKVGKSITLFSYNLNGRESENGDIV